MEMTVVLELLIIVLAEAAEAAEAQESTLVLLNGKMLGLIVEVTQI
jgi:hypothetical protein